MERTNSQDVKMLNGIIKSLKNIKRAFEDNDIQTPQQLQLEELTHLACTQLITNIHEYGNRLQKKTRDKLVNLGKIKLGVMRHISSPFMTALILERFTIFANV